MEYWGIIIAALTGIAGVAIGIAALVQAVRSSHVLDGMADDIDRLATLSEEAAALLPIPHVAFVVQGEPADTAAFRLKWPTPVDVQAVVGAAVSRANESKPEIPRAPWPGYAFSSLQPTQRQVKEYEAEVETYVERLQGKLPERVEFEKDLARLAVLGLRLSNDGATPLEDARLVIEMGGGIRPREGIPKPPRLPAVPRFRSLYDSLVIAPRFIPSLHPESRWELASGYRIVAPDTVEWAAGDVQHGQSVDAPPLVVAAEEPGESVLIWRVHADNLREPATGTLRLVVAPPQGEAPPPLQSLKAVGLEEDVADEDED